MKQSDQKWEIPLPLLPIPSCTCSSSNHEPKLIKDSRPITPPVSRYARYQSVILLNHSIYPTSLDERSPDFASSRTNTCSRPRDRVQLQTTMCYPQLLDCHRFWRGCLPTVRGFGRERVEDWMLGRGQSGIMFEGRLC